SHELKTPLTSISALTQILSKKLANNEDTFIPSAIEKVNFQLRKMIGMINSFLNVSRLESGKLYIEKTDFKLSELIKEEIDEAKLTTGTHTITLVKSPEMVINADRARLGSVISNFLSNAIKYSPDGKTIVVGFEPRGTEVMVYVKDEGMGVRAADLDKIFGQYYRVDIAETRQISGFGIGLYLSSEIIRRHQGKIWVESEPGKGAKFCFTLPI
ncbi:sensor histidine kinase, partial [Mucilaginibacter endophyticus]|uniref:sensor histidine kinase n=1 Tax=Mucilaginibacter endophyticus TaxID=2675003 RepID=UPI001FC94718